MITDVTPNARRFRLRLSFLQWFTLAIFLALIAIGWVSMQGDSIRALFATTSFVEYEEAPRGQPPDATTPRP